MRMSWGSNTIDIFYDTNSAPYAMKYNGTVYYYVTNLQGDVMRIVNASGTVMASYDYDPYGKVLSATGTLADLNPLRYRGYVYDQETGFYNVSGRYYDPLVSRWINADEQISGVGGDLGGNNLFAYCFNNPVNLIDPTGNWPSREQVVAAMRGNQKAYDTVQTVLGIAGGGAIAIGLTNPGVTGNAAKPSKNAQVVHKVSTTGTPNTSFDKLYKGNTGAFQRTYYDFKGNVSLQVDFTSHGNHSIHSNVHLHIWGG